MKWSNEVIGRVSEFIVQPIDEQIEAERKQVGARVAIKVGDDYVPADVCKLASKYPEKLMWDASITFREEDSEYTTIYFKVPCGDRFMPKLGDMPHKDRAVLFGVTDDIKRIEQLRATKYKTKRRIRCTLEGLRTDSKIKKEFPEAYDAYLKMMGMPSNNTCDNVEQLRAELTTILKK